MSVEDRFVKIVRELDEELTEAQKRNVELTSKLRMANYPIEQATECGRCGVYKHTPWKSCDHGYVCATCLTELHAEKKAEVCAILSEVLASATPSKRENPAMFAAWEKAKAFLSKGEGNNDDV